MSYVLLLGRCGACRAAISIRYPLVEAANGLLYLGVAATASSWAEALVAMAFVTALLVLSLIDLDHQILPDVITLPGVVAGLAASWLPGPPRPLDAVLTSAGAYLGFMALAKAWQRARGIEALGEGDWKMVAMMGAFLGWERTILAVLLASVSGTVVGLTLILFRGRSFQQRLPLGTFLGASGIAALFVGRPIVDWYRGLLDV